MLSPLTPLLVAETVDHASIPLNDLIQQKGHDPFKRVWTPFHNLHEAVRAAVHQIHDAVKLAQERAREKKLLRSGLECRVIIHLPSVHAGVQSDVTNENLLNSLRAASRSGQLARAFVVSRTNITMADHSNTKDVGSTDWSFGQPFALDSAGRLAGTAIVLPPTGQKCVRCWRFVVGDAEAEAADGFGPKAMLNVPVESAVDGHEHELCTRCMVAILERDHVASVENTV